MNPLEPTHSVRVQLAKCRFEEKGGGVPSEPRVRCVVCRGVGYVTVMPEDGLILVHAVQSPFEQPQVAHLPVQRCVLTRYRVFLAWGRWRRAELFPRVSRHWPRLVFSPPRRAPRRGVDGAGSLRGDGDAAGLAYRALERCVARGVQPAASMASGVAEPRAAPRTRRRCGLHAGRRSAVNFAALGTRYRSDVTHGV